MIRLLSFLSSVLFLFLAGCIVMGPNYQRPQVSMPDQWPGIDQGESIREKWWEAYQDPVLNRLVEEALHNNRDIKIAAARLEEARTVLGLAQASRLPQAALNGSAASNRLSENGLFGGFSGVDLGYEDYQLGLNMSYEIDFWGKYQRTTEGARATLLSAQFSREAVSISLVTDICRGYFNLRSLDAQIAVMKRTLKSRQTSLSLQQRRYDAGVSSELELRQMEAETAQVRALLAGLENQLAQQETSLSVLLGRSPRAIVASSPERGTDIESLTVPPAVPSGLPSGLLERRPDLRQVEQELIAANAQIGVAKAAYYPTLSLTGALGVESLSLSNLLSLPSRMWQFTANAGQLIFDGGRTGYIETAAEARQKGAMERYQQAIQNAFRDTLNALVAERKAREIHEAQHQRFKALDSALTLAEMRYKSGISSLLDVLDSERGLLDAELQEIDSHRAQLAATADLYKALGGGWKPEYPTDPVSGVSIGKK